jgi:drug/metabolite transporter (DMT)-like permease
MLAIALGLASSLSWGFSDFLGGLQSRRFSVLSVLLVSQPVGLAIALVLALALGGTLPAGSAAIAAGAGAAGVVALGSFYWAMAAGPISIVAPVGAMGTAIPVVVGLARGEDPAAIQLLGLVVALGGIVLAVREADGPEATSVPRRALLAAGLAAVGFGTFFVGVDSAANHDALWATAFARAGEVTAVVLAALVAAAAAPDKLRFPRSAVPVLLAIGVLDILATTLFAFASREGLLALTAVAASLYPVTTVLLARFVLSERLVPLQKAGVALALTGVVMIAAGG